MRMIAGLLRALVRLNQLVLSPYLGGRCRYLPSCSDYALEALASHGALGGSWLTLKRLARCRPFGGFGYDPVPAPNHRHLAADGGCCRAPVSSEG